MANANITHSMVAKEIAVRVNNMLVCNNTWYRAYEREWEQSPNGWKPGSQITVSLPIRYTVGTTASVASATDVTMLKTAITATNVSNVVMAYTSQEMTHDINDFMDRHVQPAAEAIASDINRRAWAQVALEVANTHSAGTTPNALSFIAAAGQKLDEYAAPANDRFISWNPSAKWSMSSIIGTLQNQTVSGKALMDGMVPDVLGFNHYMSQVMPSQLAGTVTGGTAAVSGANQGTVTVTSNAIPEGTIHASAGTGTPKAGDTFTVAGVYSVNPITKQSTGSLKDFVVTTNASFNTGTADIIFAPGMVTSGAYQNVSAAPSSGVAITFTFGTGSKTFPLSMAYHRRAFAFCTIPLYLPESAGVKVRMSSGGVSVRLLKDYGILADAETTRVDVLWAAKTIDPTLAMRLPGVGA